MLATDHCIGAERSEPTHLAGSRLWQTRSHYSVVRCDSLVNDSIRPISGAPRSEGTHEKTPQRRTGALRRLNCRQTPGQSLPQYVAEQEILGGTSSPSIAFAVVYRLQSSANRPSLAGGSGSPTSPKKGPGGLADAMEENERPRGMADPRMP
jgi:hypothetical protein